MVKSFFLLVLLVNCLNLFGQENSNSIYSNLKIESKTIIFEKIYSKDSVSIDSLTKLINFSLGVVPQIEGLQKSGEGFVGRLKNCSFDNSLYDGSYMSRIICLNHPMFATFSIQIKEGRYRVVVSNIYFLVNLPTAGVFNTIAKLEDALMKKDKEKFSAKPMNIRAGEYLQKYLSAMFQLKTIKNDW